MTNPNNIMGTNAGFGGRTSPNAFNDDLAAYSRGVLNGWVCSPKSGMTVELGGDGVTRDVAIAEDNAGNRTTINNRIGAPVEVTLSTAPSSGNRIDVIVAYVDNPSSATASDVDFAPAAGIIAVAGAPAGTPTPPDESAIRTAIGNDGANGSTAYYVVLAQITVGTNVATIGSGAIEQGELAKVNNNLSKSISLLIGLNQYNSQSISSSYFDPSLTASGTLYLAQSNNSGTFKVYGNMNVSNSSGNSVSYTAQAIPGLTGKYGIKTTLKLNVPPTTAFEIVTPGMKTLHNGDASQITNLLYLAIAVGTDGFIYVNSQTTSTLTFDDSTVTKWWLMPCLYFNTNFGDSSGS